MWSRTKFFYHWIRGITTPTTSRWGILTITFSASFALIAISMSTWGVYEMSPITPQTATILFWVGIGAIALGVIVSFIWLIFCQKPDADTTSKDIKAIKQMLEEDRQQRQDVQTTLLVIGLILNVFRKGK